MAVVMARDTLLLEQWGQLSTDLHESDLTHLKGLLPLLIIPHPQNYAFPPVTAHFPGPEALVYCFQVIPQKIAFQLYDAVLVGHVGVVVQSR